MKKLVLLAIAAIFMIGCGGQTDKETAAAPQDMEESEISMFDDLKEKAGEYTDKILETNEEMIEENTSIDL